LSVLREISGISSSKLRVVCGTLGLIAMQIVLDLTP